MLKRYTFLLLLFAVFTFDGFGQTNPTAQSLPYSQDFSSLVHTATAYPAGWQGWTISTSPGASFNTSAPTADRTLTASSTAAITSANVHNYNGKIGFLNGASLDLSLILSVNTTGKSGVAISYDIMTIRNPYDGTSNTRINEVTLQYRIGTSGTFTNLTGVEYQNNTTLQTGTVTSPQNSLTRTITLPAGCDNQAVVQLRWASRQVSGGGSRPSFAVDNVSLTVGEPTNSASAVNFTSVGTTGMTINWTSGNGVSRAVFVREGSLGTITDPTDGTTYTASADWSNKGTQLGTSGYFCVYDGTGTSVPLTNLVSSTAYYIYVYEYNGSGSTINYKITDPGTGNQTTLSAGPDPNVALIGTDPGAAQLLAGTNKNMIYRVQMDVTTASVNLTDVGFATAGNYVAADIQGTGFRLFYSTDATLDLSDTELGNQVSSSDGVSGDVLIFTGLSQSINVGSGYLFLTADISSSATALHTLSVSLPAENDFTFDGTYTTTGSNLVAGNIHTLDALPPTLTADATSNTVDNNIDITFDNETWRGEITTVKVNDTTLTVVTDYDLSAGHLILKPGGGRACLRTASIKTVKVSATGYADAMVEQTMNVGAVNSSTSTTAISSALALGSTRTVTATAKDQYNNLVSGYTFKYDATITDNDATTDESYTIDGTARTASVTDINFVANTNVSGVVTFDITLPAIVDVNDGISVQVQLSDGTTAVGAPFTFTGATVPTVSVTSMVAINSNIIKGRDNNILQRFNFGTTNANATLNSLTVTTAGTYSVGDIKTNGFKLWYSADTLFNSVSDALLSSQAVVAPANNIVFGSLSSTILQDASGYYFVTVDLSNTAIANNTIQITSTPFTNLTFAAANLSGTNPIPAGGTKTITAITLPIVEHFDYANGSVLTDGAGWVNTSGTLGEVTVVTGNLTYAGYDMPATGNNITITPSPSETEDVRLVFPDVTTGKVYASVLLNVSAITGTDVYSIHLGNGATNFTSRVFAKVDGAGFALSIGKSAVSTYSSTLNFNQTYLIVISYEFVSGTSNDIVNLWINPDLSGVEPTPTISSSSGADVTLGIINAFYVRQATGIPAATIDAIRIATNWADAPLPVELTSFTARAAGSVVNLNWETATEVDNNGFDVERNSTGTWQKIGFVEGHGTANSPKYYNFTDKSVTGNKIQYRLRQVDNDGTFEYSNVVEVELAPTTFALDQNYPNPFNPTTMIRFSLPTTSVVILNVYNTLGEKVTTLLNGQMESGYHQVSFDAANLPSGLYLYEIKAGEFSSIKKMVLLK